MGVFKRLKQVFNQLVKSIGGRPRRTVPAIIEPLEGIRLFSTYDFNVPTGSGAHVVTLLPNSTAGVDIYVDIATNPTPVQTGITNSILDIHDQSTGSTVQDFLPASVKAFTSIEIDDGALLEIHNAAGDHSVTVSDVTEDDPTVTVSDGTYTGVDVFETNPAVPIKIVGASAGGDTITIADTGIGRDFEIVSVDTGSATNDLIHVENASDVQVATGAGTDTVQASDGADVTVDFGNNVGVGNLLTATGTGTAVHLAVAQTIDTVTLNSDAVVDFEQTSGQTVVGTFNTTTSSSTVNVASSADVSVLSASTIRTLNILGKMELKQTSHYTQQMNIDVLNLRNGSSVITGILDVGAQKVIVTGTSITEIRAYLDSAYRVGSGTLHEDWLGNGITTSHAIAFKDDYGIAYATAAENSMANGLTLSGSQILIMPTTQGDGNFDGQTDIQDLPIWNNNFSTGTNWAHGDYNYDHTNDIADLSKWNNAFSDTFSF